MPKPDRKRNESQQPLGQAFACALRGIADTVIGQRNAKIQIGFALVAIILGFALSISAAQWLAIIICIGAVLALEAINTAIEATVDLLSPEWHELARKAKDCAAGAVLIASVASLVVGIIIFAPALAAVAGL